MVRKSKYSWLRHAANAATGAIGGAAAWIRRYREAAGAGPALRGAKKTAMRMRKRTRAVARVLTKTRVGGSVLIKGAGAFSKWFPIPGKLSLSRRVLSGISGKNQYIFNMAQRLTTADGRQNATSVIYYDKLPIQNMLNSVTTPANPTRRILLKSSYHEYTFTNASNAVAYLTLYDITYKRDLEVSADPDVYTPEICWNSGEIQEGNALGSSLVGSYPTRIGRFNDFYRIANKSTHLLQPGEVHKHKVLLRPNRFISQNLVSEKNYYRGLSSATMFVVQGTPVDNVGDTYLVDVSGLDTTGFAQAEGRITTDESGNLVNTFGVPPGGAQSVVTTSPCAINCVYSARYQFHWIDDMDSDVTVSNALLSGVGGLDVMEPTGIPYAVINT